jgi:uncharacterized protein YcbK (DUF882 family)
MIHDSGFTRRKFLTSSALAALAVLTPRRSFALFTRCISPERRLSFYNLHTEEYLETVYWVCGKHSSEALARIDYILRDHRTGDVETIDTRLLDLLYVLGLKLESQQPYHVISGYRSPQTNALLHSRSTGTAKNSMHVHGKAVDIRLPDCSLPSLHRAAVNLKRGGVGYYPRSNFVHIDVGRVRYWSHLK